MGLRSKFIVIFLLFAGVLYVNYPNFLEFIPGLKKDSSALYQEKARSFQSALSLLHSLDLFLVDKENNRIAVIGTDPSAVLELASLDLFSEFFQNLETWHQEDSYFLLFKQNTKNVTAIAADLNDLISYAKKITKIEFFAGTSEIGFFAQEGELLFEGTEPIRSFLANELDWLYNPELKFYSSKEKDPKLLVNLGLDLKGGIYLDLDLQLEPIFENLAKNLREDLRGYFLENNIFFLNIELAVDRSSLNILLTPNQEVDWQTQDIQQILSDFVIEDQGKGVFLAKIPDDKKDIIQASALDQVVNILNNRIDLLGVKEPTIQKKGKNSIVVQLPGQSDPARARKIIQQSAKLEFRFVVENANPEYPEENLVLVYEQKDTQSGEILSVERIVVEDIVVLSGERVKDARVSYSQTTGVPYVTLTFNSQGADIFGEITAKNVGRNLAIVLDDKIQSYPRINEAIYGGNAQITGNFSNKEASDLALVLRSGSLPTSLVINEERTVGASLGEDSIRSSMIALLLGFIFVILLLLCYYRLAGLFCIFALIFNILIIFAALSYFQATLTLPGMAGIILTVGMAVDANILIFERIKEELASTNLHKAIGQGFQRSLWTILDANITTLLASIILFYFGTGPIKGFAVTLSIGIVASLFTSLFVSRFLFEFFYRTAPKEQKLSI